MQTFKLTKKILALLIVGFYIHSCPVFAEATGDDNTHQAHSMDWPGLYYAFLPCDDCKGIKTTLALNKNNTYVLTSEYLGKSIREFVEKGKFAWGEQKDTIILTPRKGGTNPQLFLVGQDMLTKLDANGNRVTGEMASRYTFRRKDVTELPLGHSGH